MPELSCGDTFASFEDLDRAVQEWSRSNAQKFYIRDSRTINAASKKTKRYLNPALRFYQVVYSCIKGGRHFKSRLQGLRKRKTFKDDCIAYVKARISKDGCMLEIIEVKDVHNHTTSKVLFNYLPQERRLPGNIKDEVRHLMQHGANKKLVKRTIQEKTGKKVLLKDINNITVTATHDKNSIEKTVLLIHEKYGSDCELLLEGDTFKGLLRCTQRMQQMMKAYPEFLGIDATYKLLEIRTPVYVIHVEDGNASSEIICVGVLVSEDFQSMEWLLQTFKKLNPVWTATKCIMANKDLGERRILKQEFPQATVLICIFHVLQIFRREITTEKISITSEQRNKLLGILQKMVWARNPADDTYLNALENEAPQKVLDYFDTNWRQCSDEWSLGPTYNKGNFLNTTNNRLEAINGKLKSAIKKFSTLEGFIGKLFTILFALSDESDNKAAMTLYKRPSNQAMERVQKRYYSLLTPYAFEHVSRELKRSNNMTDLQQNGAHYLYNSSAGVVSITSTHCSCPLVSSMLLPCHHIFAVRAKDGEDLYDEALCSPRWSRDHYLGQRDRLNACSTTMDADMGDPESHCTEYRPTNVSQENVCK
ncbi:zinc finger SWIM domain-containing protein 1-like [Ornithodoros turicata]|uniref:zinc finger SWIM domain-containing protein 1-like n=1 Tax=Ornithodoros turicata TaxID=34597 RepID=UPI00313999FD